jgi:cytochrome c biogenesis protein CcmG, thiol:disulfide interchange protein DsbE
MRRLAAILAGLALVAVLVVGLNQAGGGDSGASARPPFYLAKARRDLAGAPAPLAALHDQSAQLLGGGRTAFRRRLAQLEG